MILLCYSIWTSNTFWTALSAIGSFVASFVAIRIACFPPKPKIMCSISHMPPSHLFVKKHWYRLYIENKGMASARDVRVFLIQGWDKKGKNATNDENSSLTFTPLPLKVANSKTDTSCVNAIPMNSGIFFDFISIQENGKMHIETDGQWEGISADLNIDTYTFEVAVVGENFECTNFNVKVTHGNSPLNFKVESVRKS